MSVAENIETVVNTFQEGRKLSEQELGLDELIAELNKFDSRYRSVAFEGASMGVALNNSIETWKIYLKATEKHKTQVHIGLGWAIADQQLNLEETLSHIEPEFRIKVLDGYGYWFGLFRKRLSIRTQQIPAEISAELQPGFDQGIGRAIWYVAKGEIPKVVNIINHFSENRKPKLWQGIGVASTYVGGCSEDELTELREASGDFSKSLEAGIDSAIKSMETAQA